MKRKAICMILALCIAISCMAFSGFAASAKTAEQAETGAVTDIAGISAYALRRNTVFFA